MALAHARWSSPARSTDTGTPAARSTARSFDAVSAVTVAMPRDCLPAAASSASRSRSWAARSRRASSSSPSPPAGFAACWSMYFWTMCWPRGWSTRPRQRRVATSAQTQQLSDGAVTALVMSKPCVLSSGVASWCVTKHAKQKWYLPPPQDGATASNLGAGQALHARVASSILQTMHLPSRGCWR